MSSLAGSQCPSCCDCFYPRRAACPRCGSERMEDCTFSGKGDVYSYTVMPDTAGQALTAPNAAGAAQASQTLALVHLAEGAYVTARLEDIEPAAIFIGLPVEAADGRDRLAFHMRRSLVD